jgi:hypothetical protein
MYKLILLYSFFIISYSFQLKIVKSSILKLPFNINLHHIVVLYENNDSYAIDFSPIDQSIKTLFNLVIGKNVKSKIKIRNIDISNIDINSNNFINIWNAKNDIKIDNIKSKKIKKFINKYYYIKKDINLYNFNCQHFAKILYDDYMNNIIKYE